MDSTVLAIFLAATFVGALTSGLSGFAMGMVLSGIWLHIIPPGQAVVLIVACGLVTQGYAIWKLRGAFSWRAVAPFLIGSAVGVPAGALALTHVDPAVLRPTLGALLVLFAVYSLAKPAFKPVPGGAAADVGVGLVNGVLGGLTGLTGIIVTIWCQLRGWPKDRQRAVFQPVNFATIAVSAVSLTAAGAVTADTVRMYLLALPVLLAGLWLGLKLYGRLDDAQFGKVLLVLLLLSGAALAAPLAVEQLARIESPNVDPVRPSWNSRAPTDYGWIMDKPNG